MSSTENIDYVLLKYNMLGYKYIKILYSGGGDSGEIDEMYITKETIDDLHDTYGTEWVALIEDKDYGILQDFACENIIEKYEDWWNNDGGSGALLINLLDGEFKVINEIYYQQSDTFEHDGNIFAN
jgi:hypothetical protein